MRTTVIGFIVAVAIIFSVPVSAADRNPPHVLDDAFSLLHELDAIQAKRFIDALYQQSLDAIKDHFDVQGSLQPDENGERQGHLILRFYPRGKAHSEDKIEAETMFGFSNRQDQDHLHFDFKFSQDRKPTISPEDYI